MIELEAPSLVSVEASAFGLVTVTSVLIVSAILELEIAVSVVIVSETSKSGIE